MKGDMFVASRDGDFCSIQRLYRENPGLLQELASEGNSFLHIAAREGHSELVSWLLTRLSGYRFMKKIRNADKNTALHEGAKGGSEQVVSTLLACNKSAVSKRNQFGETALIIASENGHVEAVRLLLEATPWFMILWPKNDHQTCLHVAAYEGHLDVVRLILGKFSYWHVVHLISLFPDRHGATLHGAVHGRHLDIVDQIMMTNLKSWWCRHWFDNNLMTKKDLFGRCPIHVAVLNGYLEIVERFISVMPDCIEIRSRDHKTPLHFAVEYNKKDVVEKFLYMVKPTKVAKLVSYDHDISGNTALHLAAQNGVDPQLVEYLLSFPGVRVNALNSEAQSALDIANSVECDKNPNYSSIAMILQDNGASHRSIRHCEAFGWPKQSK
ncbi:ankyrin repeat-containing protein ITN1-like [Cryptomeria japonica]|uniref:ankyrin repeat-containing protein ITN1-like n=1 Tax=Cryptomeria japonica TaxID=3369 RepID=UPI0027DA71F8|nr:ankyrin repeat-containing protein ITN1-like [Cryptomeria japonica]